MARLQAPIEAVAGTYAEFMASMDALAEAVPDMGQRQRAVIKLMMKKKIPLPKILNDLDACIGALENEGRTFRDESEKHLEKKIGGLKAESESISASISSKRDQMTSLEAEIAGLRSSKDLKDREVRSAEEMAVLVRSRFQAVYGSTHAAMTAQRKQVSDLIDKENQ
jgi:septal ring factor EnvC (AmiA/AmiB activator)